MSLTAARELAVLAVVVAHPSHGYDIAAAFERGPLALLGLKKSAVYAILARFVKRGWVEERAEPSGNYPDRQVVYPTEAARPALAGMLAAGLELTQTPAMALAMLHDMGHDISGVAAEAVRLRDAQLAEFDAVHAGSATQALARAVIVAERDVLSGLAS